MKNVDPAVLMVFSPQKRNSRPIENSPRKKFKKMWDGEVGFRFYECTNMNFVRIVQIVTKITSNDSSIVEKFFDVFDDGRRSIVKRRKKKLE